MIRILLMTFLALSHSLQVYSMRTSKQEDEKITFVQIKPLTKQNQDFSASDLARSSKTDDISLQSSPVYSLTINKATGERLRRNTDTTKKSVDYDDSNKESEDRFDTSEAVTDKETGEVPNGDSNASIKLNNGLVQTGSYGKNIVSSLHKTKLLSKKYYGNYNTPNSAYEKYLETRQFRTRCRCERIWNCPKIQISVPRCPEEYFMCCF